MITEAGRRKLDELRLADPIAEQRLLPWGGRSPRELTQAALARSLAPRGAVAEPISDEDALIDEQCRRHFHGS